MGAAEMAPETVGVKGQGAGVEGMGATTASQVVAPTRAGGRYKVYRCVMAWEPDQGEYIVLKFVARRVNEIPGDVVEFLKHTHINVEYLDSARLIMTAEEGVGGDMPLSINIIVDMELADVAEEEADKLVVSFLRDIRYDAEDAVGMFAKFIATATKIHEPYLDRGVEAYIYNPGGDIRIIKMAVIYKG